MKKLIIYSIVFAAYLYLFSWTAHKLTSCSPNWWNVPTICLMFIVLIVLAQKLLKAQDDYSERKNKL